MSAPEVKNAPPSRPLTSGGGTGLWATNLTMLGIGAIIGAGIFVLTGLAAALQNRSGADVTAAGRWGPK